MTQKDKELLLKDLCARLPYGVICEDGYGHVLELNSIDNPNNTTFKCSDNIFWTTDLDKCKPYLFPLSSMTEEQAKEMQEIVGDPKIACIFRKTMGLELWLESCDTDPTIWLDTIFEVQDWLNKNHFDYRGLIKKGLAIEVNKSNNPYKE